MAQQELEDQGIFDNRDDFTLVIQPFFEGMTEPPMVLFASNPLPQTGALKEH